jgi:hypothetical protein
VRRVIANTGIPRNWALDAGAVRRFDGVGYREGAGDRVADAEQIIEETRAAQGTPQQKETAAGC